MCYNQAMIKTIIFDIGGVITETDFGAVYANFGSRIGLNKEIVENYHKENFSDMLLGVLSIEDFWRDMRNLGGNANLPYEDIWLEEIINNRKINTELLAMIQELRKTYTVGVLSNLTPSRLIADKKIGLYSNFDYAVLSCVEHLKKPDPAFYNLALERGSATPEETVFIDDQKRQIEAAEALGIKTILYVYGKNEKLIDGLNMVGVVAGDMKKSTK